MFERRKKKRILPAIRKHKQPVSALTHLFHGIEIVPGGNACKDAQSISHKRFLSDEAPRLPLDQCERPQGCDCKYKHFVDRRTDEARRASDAGLPQNDYPEEKRQRVGRRITDD